MTEVVSMRRVCATLSCGTIAHRRRRHCDDCRSKRDVFLRRDPCTDSEILKETLRERMSGVDGPVLKRIRSMGVGCCRMCRSDTIPGRMYCSEACRTHGRMGGGKTIVIDGIDAKPTEHARRLGIADGTFYARLRKMSVEDALTTPIRESMRR